MLPDRFAAVRQRFQALREGGSPSRPRFAAIAAAVSALTVTLSGCGLSTTLLTAREPGTIVVEVTRMVSIDTPGTEGSAAPTTESITLTTFTETSAAGDEQRAFIKTSLTRPGYQHVEVGDSLQLYDPTDNTIYVTTDRGWESAVDRQMARQAPPGSKSGSKSVSFTYSTSPGRTSVFEQQLHAGLYKRAGRTEIDGRAALKLVPTRPSVPLGPHSGAHELLGTVYVTPRTYYPIKEIIRPQSGSGFSSTLVDSWLTYKVLPATTANLWLVSLSARHPTARVVHGASAYLRAQAAENRAA